jgi:D-alanyl-lipoteichoic acid acyltransferase DltB (MBOAT superfamily)
MVIFGAYPLLQASKGSARSILFGLISFAGVGFIGGIEIALIASGLTIAGWFAAHAITQTDKKKSYLFFVGVIICLLTLYKVLQTSTVVSRIFSTSGVFGDSLLNSLAFLGFSYSALRMIDFILAANSGTKVLNPLALFGYFFPIHMLIAGPICLYKDYLKIDDTPDTTHYRDFAQIINYLATGLLYKVVIAESIRMVGWGLHSSILSDSLLDTGLIFIYLFFDFAGYSMIAVAIGQLLGVPTPNNFDRPFRALSVTDFWTRWHISLGTFIRKNVYYPIQVALVRRHGIQHAKKIAFFSSAAAFSVVGLWHQFSLNFLLWGFLLGIIMGAEKLIRDKTAFFNTDKTTLFRKLAGPIYVFVVISCSLHLIINDML